MKLPYRHTKWYVSSDCSNLVEIFKYFYERKITANVFNVLEHELSQPVVNGGNEVFGDFDEYTRNLTLSRDKLTIYICEGKGVRIAAVSDREGWKS